MSRNNNSVYEFEFQITRTQGLIGLRVRKDIVLTGGNCLTVIGFVEPCMVSQLGYIEIGDEIITIDGKPVRTEEDIIFLTDRLDNDLVKIKIRRNNYNDEEDRMKKYGLRYIEQLQHIDTLKSTLRKDHIDLAEATLQLGILLSESGDYQNALVAIEEALNNAYGTANGINHIVALCLCALAHISYKTKKFPDARRQLWEAVEILKKLGHSSQLPLLQTYFKLLSVADAQESAEDREFTRKKVEDLRQVIMESLVSSHHATRSFSSYPLLSPPLSSAPLSLW
jgi:tetratricopeptide (TPR) repeat protein